MGKIYLQENLTCEYFHARKFLVFYFNASNLYFMQFVYRDNLSYRDKRIEQ